MSNVVIYKTRENNKKVKITGTYDMGCQKRSYGRIYDSSSGYVIIIGGKRKGIIGMVIYSKAFRNCDAAGNRGEES